MDYHVEAPSLVTPEAGSETSSKKKKKINAGYLVQKPHGLRFHSGQPGVGCLSLLGLGSPPPSRKQFHQC